MVKKVAAYHLMRGDLVALAGFSAESARVLGKRGADTFLYTCGEARYFLLAIEYHTSNIEQWYNIIKEADKQMAQKMPKDKDIYYAEPWRQDVMATVFEFDAELVCVRTLFDRLVQVLQTPLSIQLPRSIKNFIKKTNGEVNHPLSRQLKKAWEDWGTQSADYRDCLIHYCRLHFGLDEFFTRTKSRKLLIPDNPEDRARKTFCYEKQIQLIDYAFEISKRCHQLTTSLFEQIFELLITEEFSNSAEFTYWDKFPEVDTKRIKGSYKLLVSPGLICDNEGQKIRIPRYVRLENGKISLDDIVLSEEFLNTLKYPFTWDDNPVLPVEIYGAIKKANSK